MCSSDLTAALSGPTVKAGDGSAASGGGSASAGDHNTVVTQNITLNVYGREDFDLAHHPRLMERLLEATQRGYAAKRDPAEIRNEILRLAAEGLFRAPANQTLCGHDPKTGEVGVRLAPGDWRPRPAQTVARDRVVEIDRSLTYGDPALQTKRFADDAEEEAWCVGDGAAGIADAASKNARDRTEGKTTGLAAAKDP